MAQINIESEFQRAIAFVKASKLEFPLSKRVQWGCATVNWYGPNERLYEPNPSGLVMAFIAPVVEGGELVDLCAVEARTNRWATRMGYGQGLGIDAIEPARMGGELTLVDTAMAWLSWPVDAVYLFDLRSVHFALRDVPKITCGTLELAERVLALLPPSEADRVVMPDE